MAGKPTYEELELRVEELEKTDNERTSFDRKLKLLSLAVDQSSEGIAMSGLDGNLQYLNNAFAEMHGYSPEKIIGKNLSIFHTLDQMPSVEAANLEIKQTGFFKGEIWHVKSDGTVFPTLMHNSLIRDEMNKPIGMMGTIRDISDIKQSEKALLESEEKYRNLVEQAIDGVVIVQDGTVKFANNRIADLLGYNIGEMHNTLFIDYVFPDDRNRIKELHERRIKEDDVPDIYETQGLHKDGRKIDVETNAGIITYHGKPAVLAFIRDITERKQAEEKLKESELKHKTLINNIPGMVYRGYADWSAEIISDSEEICGYTNKELNSEKEGWLSIIHSDDKARVTMESSELTKRKQSTVQTYRIVTKGGDNCWVEDRKTSLFTEYGEFVGIDGIVFDITKRKQAEEALRESEKRYRAVVDSQTELICRFLPDGTLTFVNDAYCRYFDKSREELIGHKFMPLIPESDQDKVFESIASLNPNTPVITLEHRVFAPNGEICWHKWTNRAIFDDKGNLVEYQAVGWDITNRVRIEESLQKVHDELEHRVEERTRELEVQKKRLRVLSSWLFKAQEQERRRVSKELHDEMGPALAILKLRLRSFQRGFPEGQSSLKEEFDDTVQYIDQIIETVRRLSKDLSPAILEDLGLSSALEWLIENFGKQHSIRTSVEMVNIDNLFSQETQTNIYRIFQEALSNIVKHARAGHVSFVVKKEVKGSVFFLIKDNGKGFDVNEAEAVNIVERGMGLTVMNERAHMIGGILDIQSRPGEGTRITLEILA